MSSGDEVFRRIQSVARSIAAKSGTSALHLNEAIRRVGIVDAQYDTWIPHQRLTFGRTFSGVEHQITLIDDEPDRGYEGPAVLGDKSQHPGPSACG